MTVHFLTHLQLGVMRKVAFLEPWFKFPIPGSEYWAQQLRWPHTTGISELCPWVLIPDSSSLLMWTLAGSSDEPRNWKLARTLCLSNKWDEKKKSQSITMSRWMWDSPANLPVPPSPHLQMRTVNLLSGMVVVMVWNGEPRSCSRSLGGFF